MKYLLPTLLTIILTLNNMLIVKAQDKSRLYVSPAGHDANYGTYKSPLRTIDEAIKRSNSSKAHEREIILLNGRYELEHTIVINEEKGKGQLSLKAEKPGHVFLSGGKQVSRKAIRRVQNPSIVRRLQTTVQKSIYEIDFQKLQIPFSGMHATGFGRPSIPSWTEIFEDNTPGHIAQWPNDTTLLIGKIHETGVSSKDGEEAPYPIFEYDGNHPALWTGIKDNFWIGGYFAHGYADDIIRAERVDTISHTIHTAQHTVYGFMTGAPWRRWFALNLLEELDVPGEYVLDEKSKKLYYYPQQEKIGNIHVSILNTPILAVENCTDVTVEGIIFEYGRSMAIYMENTENVLVRNCVVRNMGNVGICIGQGTYNTEKKKIRPHAAEAGGMATSRLIGDLQGKVYEDVLFDRKAGKNNGIVDCRIYQVGAGGISLGGGNRARLEPAGNYVKNCRIHDFNRIEKSYRAGIWIDGVGCRVTKCDLYNAPSMAILFHGNNHLIEKCNITHVCNEVDDQGAIYYGRDPSERGNVIRYCFFHELSPKHRVTATYHDDGSCGTQVYGSIYYKAGSLPVLIGGGQDKTIRTVTTSS